MAAGLLGAALLLASVKIDRDQVDAKTKIEWLPVNDRSLEIVAGSPLDFAELSGDLSGDTPVTIVGERLMVNGRSPAINCAMLAPGFSLTIGSDFPDHETAERYAEQLRRHGYNLVRFHHIDSLLMRGAREDFGFNAVQMDRFHYLMAALKKRGIRWSLDLMTSDNGALGGIFPSRWSERRGMRVRVYVEPAAFAHWRTLATKLLTVINPHTGLALAQDPSTAMLVLLNEGAINHQAGIASRRAGESRFPDLLRPAYAQWLGKRGDAAAADGPLPEFGERGEAQERFQRFVTDRQITITRAMTAVVRAAGFKGPVTAFDSWSQLNTVPSRRDLPLVDMHGYDQVPPGGKPGARVRSLSSLGNAAPYLQDIAATRFFGRPFTVTEHDQPFWNPYRYESGLAAPALASLQGWEMICRHADGPINLAYDGIGSRKQALQPDGGGLDPVARAGETLTALLLLRREIAAAPGRIGMTLSDAEALVGGGWRELPKALTAAAWVAQIGFVDERTRTAGIMPDVTTSGADRVSAVPMLAALRKRGLLGLANSTDPLHNRWESPGGQVLLLGDRRELRVRTLRTSAMAFERVDAPVALGPIQVISGDAPALLAFSALDAAPLAESRRILVILASDARNSGMQIESDGTLISLGHLPIQLRRVRATVMLAAPAGSNWRLVPLRLNGVRDAPVALTASAEGLETKLDTALSPRGPTTFFLLERE